MMAEKTHPDMAGLKDTAARLAVEPGTARVQKLTLNGQIYWLKVPQERGMLLRLRKGPARLLLTHEAAAIDALNAKGQPVPCILLRSPGYIVLSDVGNGLDTLLTDQMRRPEILQTATRALVNLHAANAAHGSPHLRNLCLQNGEIFFIDLEGCTAENACTNEQAHDLRLLIFSVFAKFPGDHALAATVLETYAQYGDSMVLRAAIDWADSHGWLAWLAAPLKWHEDRFRRDRTYRQYGAVRDTLDLLRQG